MWCGCVVATNCSCKRLTDAWPKLENKPSSRILHVLKGYSCNRWQAGEDWVTIIQPRNDQCERERMLISGPASHRSCRSQRRWWKHDCSGLRDAMFTWQCRDPYYTEVTNRWNVMDFSWSNWPTARDRSPRFFCELDREPDQMISVLRVFSCSRHSMNTAVDEEYGIR